MGFGEIRKNDRAINFRIAALYKLMTMSSYLVNSNYIEPSFPQCEEYGQNGYVPVSSDYYERPKDSGFLHHEEPPYQRSNYEDATYDYSNVPANSLVDYNDQHNLQPQSVHQNHESHLGTDNCSGTSANKDCSLVSESIQETPKGKEPVVYPWMKKVHVNSSKYFSQFRKSVT